MKYSVGILYSAKIFLENIKDKNISATEFRETFRKYALTDLQSILDICQVCHWIKVDEDGKCKITDKGTEILAETSAELALRKQLINIVEYYKPTWIHLIKRGRTEAKNFLPEDVKQVFKEAGLFNTWTDELVTWWDDLTIASYSAKSTENLKTGREAESKTIAYEKKRTEGEPLWLSLESNKAGYDVLSCVSKSDNAQLLIEVKGTKQKLKEAYFTLTRNEWQTGRNKKNYCMYLWILREPLLLLPVPFIEVDVHTPDDKLKGKWKTVNIPFRVFQQHKIHIK